MNEYMWQNVFILIVHGLNPGPSRAQLQDQNEVEQSLISVVLLISLFRQLFTLICKAKTRPFDVLHHHGIVNFIIKYIQQTTQALIIVIKTVQIHNIKQYTIIIISKKLNEVYN